MNESNVVCKCFETDTFTPMYVTNKCTKCILVWMNLTSIDYNTIYCTFIRLYIINVSNHAEYISRYESLH